MADAQLGSFQTPQGIIKASYQRKGEYALVGGDMLMPPPVDEDTVFLSTSADWIGTWNNGEVPYEFAQGTSFRAQQAGTEAIDLWNSLSAQTGLRFVPRNGEQDRVRIGSSEPGCFAVFGRVRGAQPVNLGPGCEDVKTAAHELGHAIGLAHEHQRPDRSQYVNINFQLLPPEIRYSWEVVEYSTTTTPYDLFSIMHYPSRAGSPTGQPIIVPVDRSISVNSVGETGRYGGITDGDILGVAQIYDGPGPNTFPPSTVPPGNGGGTPTETGTPRGTTPSCI